LARSDSIRRWPNKERHSASESRDPASTEAERSSLGLVLVAAILFLLGLKTGGR